MHKPELQTEPLIKRPAFQYYGGKFRVADWIISHFPQHEVYIEPFGGAASVLLKKRPSKSEIYNDISSDLYNFFSVLRDDELREKLLFKLRLSPVSREDFTNAIADDTTDKVERARNFFVAVNQSMQHTAINHRPTNFVLFGHHDLSGPDSWLNIINNLEQIAKRLIQVKIENRPAIDVIRQYDRENVLFYVDPPYSFKVRSDKRIAYESEMTDQDHIDLADALKSVKGKAIISGYRCELYDRLYSGWACKETKTHSKMNKPRSEAIWLSPNMAESTRTKLFN
jgi:DNA adenine methylase